ncbi:beta-lactamase/transpeptidase-like protein [Lactifluus subvellereus]|nr:beta-lactamase/transpeptidase-like protein [Lactifluus subvellereus]
MRFTFLPIIVLLHNATGGIASGWKRSSSPEPSTTGQNILTPDFVKAVQDVIDAEEIPGLTLAIVRETGPTEFGAWGIKSEDGTKMTTDTLFNLASCSKAFLSASMGILIDDFAHGHADILPDDWKLMDPWASQKANLIDILSHVSGVGSHDLSYKRNFNVVDLTRNLRNLRPSVELREQFLYNNQMYMVGAYVVTKLSGMHFEEFVNNRIFKPLSMIPQPTLSIRPSRPDEFADLIAGLGGAISSVEDLVPWVRMILNGGIDPDTNVTIIPPAEFDTITSVHSITIPNTRDQPPGFSIKGYGLGWTRFSYIGHDIILHSGGAPGVSTAIAAALSDGLGIIALTNADSKYPAIEKIILAIAQRAFNSTTYSAPPLDEQPSTSHTKRSQHADVTARADTTSTLSPLDVEGTYYNAGYGSSVLCSVQSSSSSCQSVLNDFRSVDKSLSPNSTDLFASWDGLFARHFHYTPTNGSSYSISAGTIYPEGYGRNSTPFSTVAPAAMAEFVVVNKTVVGFGVFGVTGSGRAHAGPVEEASDVWFVKV